MAGRPSCDSKASKALVLVSKEGPEFGQRTQYQWPAFIIDRGAWGQLQRDLGWRWNYPPKQTSVLLFVGEGREEPGDGGEK